MVLASSTMCFFVPAINILGGGPLSETNPLKWFNEGERTGINIVQGVQGEIWRCLCYWNIDDSSC